MHAMKSFRESIVAKEPKKPTRGAMMNAYNREKYDRLQLNLPKGSKEKYRKEAEMRGMSLTRIIEEGIKEYMENHPL